MVFKVFELMYWKEQGNKIFTNKNINLMCKIPAVDSVRGNYTSAILQLLRQWE
jgi:hypothetical protein